MKKFSILLFVFLLLSFLSCLAKENSPSALVLTAKGEIILKRGDNNQRIESGTPLYSGDELISKEQSIAAIRFVDSGAIIKLFSNSILTINTEKKVRKLDKKIYLEIGDVWSKVKREKGAYQIETPTSVATVKGTDFFTNVKEDGTTTVVTLSGIVELRTDIGAKTITKGKTGIAKKNKVPTITDTKPKQIKPEIKKEIEKGNLNILEIELEDENGELKKLRIYYK
ncbi:MAG: hypothetical protein DRH57_02760 [Candidatus Cloacimonadota bacterium]|nr:MAG: hypothetical protein DRH57_02760 [Candidatus Cloacimonadota bacterium]